MFTHFENRLGSRNFEGSQTGAHLCEEAVCLNHSQKLTKRMDRMWRNDSVNSKTSCLIIPLCSIVVVLLLFVVIVHLFMVIYFNFVVVLSL